MKSARLVPVIVLLVVQSLCALFFVVELFTEVLGLRHWAVSWEVRELLQVTASLGLILGTVAGAVLLRTTMRRMARVQRQVQVASGAFFDVVEECFEEWGLSPAEREVALLAVRGCTNGEIAAIRNKSEATIKSQMNAVFRKAAVTGRPQLLSEFVDHLIQGPAADGAADPAAARAAQASQPAA